MEYSEIFNIYKIDNIPYYNILKKVQLPEDKTSELYKTYIIPYNIPWVTLSHLIYGDLTNYWVFFLANQDKKLNPLYAEAGLKIYIIKPEYINLIIDAIRAENI